MPATHWKWAHCIAALCALPQMAKQIDFMHKILKGEYEFERESTRLNPDDET